MRQPKHLLLIFMALCASVTLAWADARGDARTHYIAGQKAYASADYKVAIKEFSAAQELAPADLNNYNLALCYDKLGDAENAITYYKQYLDKVPDAPKRSEIEASMARLDGAMKSSQAKKADEQKKLDDQKKAQADADAAKKAQADADAAKKAVVAPPVTGPATAPDGAGAAAGAGAGAGSTGTPSTGLTVSTGDAQLDRVQGINIDAIRDQRMGGASSGMADNRTGPNGGAPNGPNANPNYGGPPPNGMATMGGQNGANGAAPPGPGAPNDKPAVSTETPVYKKWWFWVVIGVSAYVVIEIASQGSTSNPGSTGHMFDKNTGMTAAPSGGYTLMRF
ncbi:MAG: tetratricopeptide repeat protein [Deltaproteobacteria bacterium]